MAYLGGADASLSLDALDGDVADASDASAGALLVTSD